MTITIYTMGELLAGFLSRNPHREFTQPGEFIGPFPNGAPAIFAAQVAELSRRAIFLGRVNDDDFSRFIIERLRHEGAITDGIHITNNVVTDTVFVSYQSPQQQDFVFNIPNNACGLFTAEHTDRDLLKQCNHLHIVGSSLFSFHVIDAVRKAITAIKSADGTASFNPNIRKEMLSIPEVTQALDCLIEYTDIFIPSESGLPFFARHKNLSEEQIVSDLLRGGVEHMTIECAQRGTSYYKPENGTLHARHIAGHNIEAVDPTDAGDCFGATFITLFLSGFPAHKTLQYADTSGALAVVQQGPMGGISSLADIEDFLQQR